ncbi:MAG: DPP IV N-terminal domain-containing protein, partial [Rhodothermales bacterium]
EKRRRLGPVFNGWHHGEGVYDGSFRRKVYEDGGDIYVYDRASNTGKRLTHTRERERDPRLVQDGIVYRSGNNLFVVRTDGARRQLTDLRPGTKPSESARDTLLYEQQLELFETISTRKKRREEGERENERLEDSRAWPPVYYFGSKELDQLSVDRHLRFAAFVLDPPEDEKRTLVPAYVTESGHVETATARPKVGLDYKSRELYVQDLARDTTYRIDLPVDSSRSHYIYGPHWGEWYGVIEARTYDNKDRWIIRLDPETGAASTLDHQHDEAWIQAPGISSQGGRSSMGWLPDGRTFFFQSEKTGRSHIYTADVESGVVTQVTRGDFDVYDPMVSRDGRTWFFSSNEASPFERHFYRMPIEGGERMPLSESIDEAALNPDEETLAVLRSEVNHPPEIYLDGERITHSPT